ncbi:MAG: putative acetamidase/formamidase [Frankiales bacterium]|nr:putative acetamidase/formamidase [Frankiales bacterium]
MTLETPVSCSPDDATAPDPQAAAEVLEKGLGRRGFLAVAAALGASGALLPTRAAQAATPAPTRLPGQVLQPGVGPVDGDHYLPTRVDEVLWGYLPRAQTRPSLVMASGRTVTIDGLSHEGLLEDQGRDPVAFFGSHGVARAAVLQDGIDVARSYARHPRDFDVDGPHVVTGPVFVKGAEVGDVLKVELLSALPRVPYGVISSRHGKGALARQLAGPAGGFTPEEAMPPVSTDGRATGDPRKYGNVSTFTPVGSSAKGVPSAFLPRSGGRKVTFPLRPFAGMMGVATVSDTTAINDPLVNSIPPTVGGGNIDINLLTVGSAFYLPVAVPGALFYIGDPHMAMGSGEVALTALEGSLRMTFRLTVCKKGAGTAPSVAFRYPFGETPDAWLPIGLSDPDGARNGQTTVLDVAMRRAVLNALDFLTADLGMDRATAYAYLSAGADFTVSQVVDRTVGVHGVVPKAHFS